MSNVHLLLLYTCYWYSQRNCNDSNSRCLFVRHGDHHETITDQEDQWIRNILNKIETKYKKSRKMPIYVVNLNSNCPAMFEFYCNVKDSDSPLLYNTFQRSHCFHEGVTIFSLELLFQLYYDWGVLPFWGSHYSPLYRYKLCKCYLHTVLFTIKILGHFSTLCIATPSTWVLLLSFYES